MLDPQGFIEQKKQVIEGTAAVGPKLKVVKERKKRERVLINQEEPKSYLDLDQGRDEVFPVSFSFNNVSIAVFAQTFAKLVNMNVLVGEEVEGVISAELKNVPWNRALDHILEMNDLAKHVDYDSRIIRIHKQEALKQIETYQRQRAEEAARNLVAKRSNLPMYTEMFRLYYTEPKNVADKISEVLGITKSEISNPQSAIYSTDPKVTIDERLNSLIVRATREELDLVAQFIENIDVATKQVLIEAFIVEASDNFLRELGTRLDNGDDTPIQGSFDNGNLILDMLTAGLATAGSPTGTLMLTAKELRFTLTALQSEGFTKIISNPKVFVLDNEKASFSQGVQIPYSATAENGATTTEFVEASTKLDVTPSVIGDGNVLLDVTVDKNDPGVDDEINKNNIKTKLIVPDRAIAVIGGIIYESGVSSESKVPGLGDNEDFGRLFKNTNERTDRRELLIFLAPRVL